MKKQLKELLKKKELVLFPVIGLVLIGVGYTLAKSEPAEVCKRKHKTCISDGRVVLIPIDTVDGRPTYNVLLSDENGIDSMYPEEIANGLNTGEWKYNEMLHLTEKP